MYSERSLGTVLVSDSKDIPALHRPYIVFTPSSRSYDLTLYPIHSTNVIINYVNYLVLVLTHKGCYKIDIKYAEMPISGSPFAAEVFDPCQVRIGRLPIGIVGKPVCFDGKHIQP